MKTTIRLPNKTTNRNISEHIFPQYKPLKDSAEVLFQAVSQYYKDGTIIDVGANIGAFIDVVMEKYPNAPIIGIEPVRKYYDHLMGKYSHLPNVFLYHCGASDVEEQKEIFISNNNIGWNTFVKEKLDSSNTSSEIVDCICLDSLSDLVDKVDIVKIDVEGFEYKVLNGMRELVKKHKPVILCEIGWGCNHSNWKEELESFEYLYSIGYETESKQMIEHLDHTTDVIFRVNQ